MPVTVDDRDDRLLRGAREVDDLLHVLRMAPGVEHDQAVAALEDDRIAVGLSTGDERTRNEVDTRCDNVRRVRSGEQLRDAALRSSLLKKPLDASLGGHTASPEGAAA